MTSRCDRCGAPLPSGAPDQPVPPDLCDGAGTRPAPSALVTAIDHYIALWCEAMRQSAVYRMRGAAPETRDAALRSDCGWEAVERIDLDGLWTAAPGDRTEAMAMLRLLVTVGWEGMDDADSAFPRGALTRVIELLERLR